MQGPERIIVCSTQHVDHFSKAWSEVSKAELLGVGSPEASIQDINPRERVGIEIIRRWLKFISLKGKEHRDWLASETDTMSILW